MSAVLNPFEAGPAAAFALFSTRLGGLMLIAPVFSARVIPVRLRVTVLVALTATAAPLVLARDAAPAVGPATLMSELLIGFALGIGAAIIVGAAQLAGDVLSYQTGLSGASTLDPLSQQQNTVLSDLLSLMVVTLILVMNGHILILEALSESVRLVPLGSAIAARDSMLALVGLGSELLRTGTRIAAPVMAAVFIGNIAMGVLARSAPQLQVFMLAYPLQILVGTAVLATALPFIGVTFTGWPEQYRTFFGSLVDTLGGG